MSTSITSVREYQLLINGEWKAAESGEVIERKCPATGEIVSVFASGGAADMLQAVAAAREAFDYGAWPKLPGLKRSEVLHKLADKMRENRDFLAKIEALEVGKNIRFAKGDIDGAIGLVEYAAGLAMQMHGESYTNLGESSAAMVVREPVGVVGMIVPWNFPALILCQKMPFALAAGCTAVIKPSEFTSGTAVEICKMAQEVGVPDGVINLVTGYGPTAGQALLDSPGVDRISFTGSTRTGRTVIQSSAADFKRVSVELGGKSPIVVFADADLDDALDAVMFGVYANQGEVCCSTGRLLIEESIADEFLAKLVARVKKLKVGEPLDESADIGALIHLDHLNKVLNYIEIGKKEGAKLLTGGRYLENEFGGKGFFVEPTIFDNVTGSMCLFQEEIFGPVLTVTRFNTVEEAIEAANNSEYGLAGSVWSKNVDKVMTVSRSLKCGTVWVNTVIDGAPQLPFGGYKSSGYGREMGTVGFEEFTEVKTIQFQIGARNHFFKER